MTLRRVVGLGFCLHPHSRADSDKTPGSYGYSGVVALPVLLHRSALKKTKAAGVPVVVSELVSNVRDHAPFFANQSTPPSLAEQAYQNARQLESKGEMAAARSEYIRAKDLDGLRFRAPEEFNGIIHALAAEQAVPVVPMKAYFEAASPHGLVGNNLMLEHLHPNAQGHQLMSRAFFDTLHQQRVLSEVWEIKRTDPSGFEGFTELDVAIGKMRILYITDHWPFKPEAETSNVVENYIPQTRAEELAKELSLERISFRNAHMKMAEYYNNAGLPQLALQEYWALVNSAPIYMKSPEAGR